MRGKKMHTVYFERGHVVKISPEPIGRYYENRDIIYDVVEIVSDGKRYNLDDVQSISSIVIPNYKTSTQHPVSEELGVTGNLDYVLRMKASRHWNRKNFNPAIACLEKATILMKDSDIGWSQKDFYRIVDWLIDLGFFKRSNRWEEWINSIFENCSNSQDNEISELKKVCKFLKTDLVESVDHANVCCEKCAMYRNRIFSLSGKDKRFPKFPMDYHWDCCLSTFPFVYGVNEPSFKCKNLVKHSNRPFVDDRTPKELQHREEWLQRLEKAAWKKREPDITRITYFRLAHVLPDDVPKTVSAFKRMQNSNSKKYQALVSKAEALGFVFPKTLEEIASWEK